MDDFVILHENKEYLKLCLDLIINELKKYKLEINIKKSRIDNIKNGIDFLGFRFYIKSNKVVMKLRNSTKNKFKKKVKYLINRNISNKECKKILSSYNGHLKLGNCSYLYRKVVKNIC
mgnify:CR=1 FL=1